MDNTDFIFSIIDIKRSDKDIEDLVKLMMESIDNIYRSAELLLILMPDDQREKREVH